MWLWGLMTASPGRRSGVLQGPRAAIDLADLAVSTSLHGSLENLRGRCVLISTQDALSAGLMLIELDGVARRIVLCTPDLSPEHLAYIIGTAGVEACVTDAADPAFGRMPRLAVSSLQGPRSLVALHGERRASHETEWVLLTSGTTGVPKLVLHTLATLTSAICGCPTPAAAGTTDSQGAIVWSTFYDIRRYGGLQIFLRAMLSGSLVLSGPDEPVPDFLGRAATARITHISGTPSHWRRALMSGAAARIAPRYVRLSGEIADQAILDSLRATYPEARVAHAFATTEAGVAFEIDDGLGGFPARLIAAPDESQAHTGDVELKVENETLHIRSPGNALRYLGEGAPALKAADGFVNAGDRVELKDGRYHFLGRRGGIVNVGGLKVHPEEVEAVINAHPWVRMSLVKPRRNPITGAVVAADVVLAGAAHGARERPSEEALRGDILEHCRRALAPHKVPAIIRFVPALEVSASGKLVRPDA